ncbi:MAG: transcriptional regulator NrdR [Nanoarchaeota archaeon]
MKCPYCSHSDSDVVDSRISTDGDAIRRRRECISCNKRFTTYERIEIADVIVIKKSGKKEKFDKNKILGGVLRACEKRPITKAQIESCLDEIEAKLRRRSSVEVPSRVIGEMVMRKLRTLDKVAYIRFASVYREFRDVKEFKDEIKKFV